MQTTVWLRVTAKINSFKYKEVDHPKYFKGCNFKVSASKPKTAADEIAIKLNLDIPNQLFLKPSLAFNINVPPPDKEDFILSAENQQNLTDLLAKQLGTNVHLSVTIPDEDT